MNQRRIEKYMLFYRKRGHTLLDQFERVTWPDLVHEMLIRMNGLSSYEFRPKPGDVVILGDYLILEYGADKKFHQIIKITNAVTSIRQYLHPESENILIGHFNMYYHKLIKPNWESYYHLRNQTTFQRLKTIILHKKFDIPIGRLRVKKFKYKKSEE